MFDIHLSKGCVALPNAIDISDKNLRERLLMSSPGYLGLNTSLQEAKRLLVALRGKEAKALGLIIPVRYRDNPPTIDVDSAFSIAEKFLLEERKSEKYAGLHFTEIKFISPMSSIMYYTFANGVQEWLDAGLHPGARFASVDKLDGHLWTDEEKHELFA